MKTWEQAANDGQILCLIDGARGIYLPQTFANYYWFALQPGMGNNSENRRSLLNGPNDEFYWDAWEEVLQCKVKWNNETWSLHQDDSLFLIRDDVAIDWEN